ncbi:hypothetical protein D9611_011157 [Ephemerocybe angulata]|uniref:Transaldolase n=1 Tax=Ephemerocybe angulata TaxID=980116 RepID=A0A8H5CD82_9AGAR|nr:hypothetical protein D9611_011157 [Tulosesus angulatus]
MVKAPMDSDAAWGSVDCSNTIAPVSNEASQGNRGVREGDERYIRTDEPISIANLLRVHGTALLVGSMNSRTLLYHHESLAGTWLGLNSVANLLFSGDPGLEYHLWVAAKKTLDHCDKTQCQKTFARRKQDTLNQFMFEIGAQSTAMPIHGPHVTYVDPRNHANAAAMVDEARRRSHLFARRGFSAENILMSIPATEAGLLAARALQKEGTNVNLYMVSSLMHAVACAETGAAAVTIHVRQVLEWFERQNALVPKSYQGGLEQHPGIETIQTIMAYFRLHKIKTRLIGTNFRKMAEIALLSDFDAVCVSTYQLDRLEWNVARYTPRKTPRAVVALRAQQAMVPEAIAIASASLGRKVGRRTQEREREGDLDIKDGEDARDRVTCSNTSVGKRTGAASDSIAPSEAPDQAGGPVCSLLRDDGHFMRRISRDSRRMIQSILSEELERLGAAMDQIEKAVAREVGLQFEGWIRARSDRVGGGGSSGGSGKEGRRSVAKQGSLRSPGADPEYQHQRRGSSDGGNEGLGAYPVERERVRTRDRRDSNGSITSTREKRSRSERGTGSGLGSPTKERYGTTEVRKVDGYGPVVGGRVYVPVAAEGVQDEEEVF